MLIYILSNYQTCTVPLNKIFRPKAFPYQQPHKLFWMQLVCKVLNWFLFDWHWWMCLTSPRTYEVVSQNDSGTNLIVLGVVVNQVQKCISYFFVLESCLFQDPLFSERDRYLRTSAETFDLGVKRSLRMIDFKKTHSITFSEIWDIIYRWVPASFTEGITEWGLGLK